MQSAEPLTVRVYKVQLKKLDVKVKVTHVPKAPPGTAEMGLPIPLFTLKNDALVKVPASMVSLKQISNTLGPWTERERIDGGVISGLLLNTLFTDPGVPPSTSFEAIQLPVNEQVSPGLMSSNDHPPLSLMGS